jgi:hypothetical protein
LVCIGVGGCGWPISLRVMQSGMDSCWLRNKAPTLAPAADAMTLHRIWHVVWIGPLSRGCLLGALVGFVGCLLKKKCPQARLWAFGAERSTIDQ